MTLPSTAAIHYHGYMKLSEERVLVTGGARRLGRSAALAFAREGAELLIHYHDAAEEAEETVRCIEEGGGRASSYRADLAVEGGGEALFRNLEADRRLPSILINSASVYGTNTWKTVGWKELERDAALTAWAPLELSRSFAARVEEGCIINILDARMVDYDSQHLSYHLAKRDLFTLTRILAIELAPNIRVNGLAPGIVLPPGNTPEKQLEAFRQATLLQRMGNPEDVAKALIFLAESSFITGEVLFVDGGRHLRGRVYGQ